ncbi:MAG: hypothetical protein RMJ00_04575 [Nitrososphaerota archaeon]|nr:hypothetical protein [Candidatus Bathyarchaeota archaeon]MCX8162493.1 hypothetical protein [Candidatus Bathyarchaeota archaeon]MDW8061954.1 hypothetical protein [Nitrososphaerota archaeon]
MRLEEAVVLDIDETIVDTSTRRQAAWRIVLGLDIPLEELEIHGSTGIAKRYGGANYRSIYLKFWSILLCYEPEGFKLLELDRPIPYAVEVVSLWSRRYKTIYLTGRTVNMKSATLNELRSMGFPVDPTLLYMAPDLDRYLEDPLSIRRILLEEITENYDVKIIVDDNPAFFEVYRELGIPTRIGLLRPRFKVDDYRYASIIADSWYSLHNVAMV